MHETKSITLVAFGIGFCIFGCNPKESDVKEGIGANMRSIAVGMELQRALAILRNFEIDVQKVDLGGTTTSEEEGWAQYVAKPSYESEDALVLLVRKESTTENESIKGMYWHLNYDHDFLLPKADRADRLLNLESVDVSILLPHEGSPQSQPAPNDNPFE